MQIFPNYTDGSIVNLMSSLLTAFGGTSTYAPLSLLPPEFLTDTTNIVLLVLDGFGYELLRQHENGTIFHKWLKGKITSVFPSTTAAGITTFLTGLAPQQHAVTGWFMHLKELGSVAATLRFQPRCCEASLRRDGVRPDMLFGTSQILRQINRQAYSIHHKQITNTDYNIAMNPCLQKRSFTTFSGCLRQIKQVISSHQEQKFIFAYWPQIDSLAHRYGIRSSEVSRHFHELAQKLASLAASLHKTDTTFIITADHGLIDTDSSKIIQMKQHPVLRDSLVLPLCGEPRAAFCYVRPSKVNQFETYVQQHFGGMCHLYRSEELIHKQWFGLFDADPRLYDRIGDYVMVMRDNYIIRDFLPGENEIFHIGNHGGLSREEMFVPLIVIKT